MAATWSESASRRSRINGAPHRCEIAPMRCGQDTSFFCPVSELFPGCTAPTEFAAGVEKLVRIGGQCDFPRPLLEFRRFDPIYT